MLMYFLIGLSLVLLGIAGLQFTYLFYVDTLYRQRKQYMQTLEHKLAVANKRLEEAEQLLAQQNEMVDEEEAWADVIEDR